MQIRGTLMVLQGYIYDGSTSSSIKLMAWELKIEKERQLSS